eukprot:46313-Chlamydomonas_euryale.AAC.1
MFMSGGIAGHQKVNALSWWMQGRTERGGKSGGWVSCGSGNVWMHALCMHGFRSSKAVPSTQMFHRKCLSCTPSAAAVRTPVPRLTHACSVVRHLRGLMRFVAAVQHAKGSPCPSRPTLFTPSAIHQVEYADGDSEALLLAGESVRLLVNAGEALPAAPAADVRRGAAALRARAAALMDTAWQPGGGARARGNAKSAADDELPTGELVVG